MAKAVKKKSAKAASGIFHNIMAASVKGNPAPKNKTNNYMEEIKIILENGSVALVNEVRNTPDGLKRFLIESEDGTFDAFTFTPDGIGGDTASPSQQSVLKQIVGKIPK